MSDQTNSILIQQLTYAAPTLLVTFVGLVLALVFIKKHTGSAILTILAILAFWIAIGGTAVAQVLVFRSQVEYGWTTLQVSQTMSIVSMSTSIVRALGLALLLTAVFVGRKAKSIAGS